MKSVKKGIMFLFKVSVIKTLIFNFYHFPLHQAFKFPVIISRTTKIFPLAGKVIINNKVKFGMIKVGLTSIPIFSPSLKYKTLFRFTSQSKTIFNGNFIINNGVKISSGGLLVFGNNFEVTGASTILCDSKIKFGDNFLMSWNCQILDNDFHSILYNNKSKHKSEPIEIGNNVWIGHSVLINKGTYISDNSVVASGSVVSRKFNNSNVLIAGIPAKCIKNNIKWKK